MKNLWVIYLFLLIFVLNSNGQSLRFNGSNNYVSLANDASLRLTSFTLEAWIKVEGAGVTSNTGVGGVVAVPILAKGRGESDAPANVNMNYFLGIDQNKKVTADFEESTGANHPVLSKTSIQDNTWTHVTVSYEPVSAVWRLYINGVLETTKDAGSNVMPASISIQPAAIGTALNSSSVPQGYFKGKIDEVRIWNIRRTDSAIRRDYKAELTSAKGLIARYGLNEGSGATVRNSVTSAPNGTLTNSPVWITGYNNSAPGVPLNPSPLSGAYSSPAATTLCASVNDANKDKLRVRFYGRKKVTKEKFTIVLLPDTQFYTAEPQGKNGGNNVMFKSQTAWIARNRAAKNIVYVGQLGDCVQNADNREVEWKRADTAIKTIESASRTGLDKGIAYGICVGNHDQAPFGDPKGTTRFYNKYFGTSRFSGRPYYGGHSGFNNDNHYQLFSTGGIDFLVICPEYDETSGFAGSGATLDWMESLVKRYPYRNVIVLSHYVLTIDATFSTRGSAIYNRLKRYPNFILMSGGHITQRDGESKRSDTYNGYTVHTLSSDYQTRARGGDGRLRILEFDPANKKIAVQTYSPYTNSFEADYNSQFNLNVNLSVAPKPFALIGEVGNLAPGSKACISWPSLEENAAYEWYATVSDGERTTTGTTRWFTTKSTTTNTANSRAEPQTEMLSQPSLKTPLTVYPNPNGTNRVTISFSQEVSGPVRVAVFDVKGNLQFKRSYKNPGNRISFSHNLSSGTYLIMIKAENSETSQKFIVIK